MTDQLIMVLIIPAGGKEAGLRGKGGGPLVPADSAESGPFLLRWRHFLWCEWRRHGRTSYRRRSLAAMNAPSPGRRVKIATPVMNLNLQ